MPLLREAGPRRPRPGRHARTSLAEEAMPDSAADPYVEWAELRPRLNLDEAKILRHKARLRSELSGEQLAELRKARLLSQHDLAFVVGVRRSKVARIEAGRLEAVRLGLLRAYVQGLGGDLEVVASFSDRRIPLR
jgi:DNA-binding XRE family transcriptional regulator